MRNGNGLLKGSSGYYNTCAIDSVFYVISQAYIKGSTFQTYWNSLDQDDVVVKHIFFLVNGANANQEIYDCRSSIAKRFVGKPDRQQNVTILFAQTCAI